ncbi:MAG: porin [Bacteroidota bacterium]
MKRLHRRFRTYGFMIGSVLMLTTTLFGQGSLDYTGGLKVKLNEDGSKYFRLIQWHQVWVRSIENNPGTVDVTGRSSDQTFDVGMRRSRFIMYSQINDDFLVLMHWGINNQTFANGGGSGTGGAGGYGAGKKPQVFIHDAWTQYKIADNLKDTRNGGLPFSMHIGVGLHYWNGLSRLTSASTLNIMTLDFPLVQYPNIEFTDQFARQYGIYAKGQLGKFGYRMHLNKPFLTDNSAALSANQAVNIATENWSVGGYWEYQFADREADVVPYKVGSYLGTKEVFNIGAGFYHHPEASGIQTLNGLERQDHTHFAFDVFYDKPLNTQKGTALTALTTLYLYDFGDNYLRNIGIMNVNPNGNAGANTSVSGFGNAEPFLGTGTISTTQVGYLLPKNLLSKGQLQPYAQFTHKQLDFLDTGIQNYDFGLNYYLDGHNAKVTLQYALRPIVTGSQVQGFELSEHRSTFTIQCQIYL